MKRLTRTEVLHIFLRASVQHINIDSLIQIPLNPFPIKRIFLYKQASSGTLSYPRGKTVRYNIARRRWFEIYLLLSHQFWTQFNTSLAFEKQKISVLTLYNIGG